MAGILAGMATPGARDVTPNPTPNWNNITGSIGVGGAVNANVTQQGFNVNPIVYRINFVSGFVDTVLKYRLNSGAYTSIVDEGTINVAPGDTLNFQGISVATPEVSSFQVLNQSDSDAILDTITVTLS